MAGPVTVDGRVILRTANGFVSVSPESATAELARDGTSRFATAEEVANRQRVREQDNASGRAKIAGKKLVSGAFDAATALIRAPAEGAAMLAGDDDALAEIQQLTGAKVQENIAGIVAEVQGKSGQKAMREYREATQAQVEANPTTALTAEVTGNVLGGLPMSGAAASGGAALTRALGGGAGARILGGAAAGAVEGGFGGEIAAHSQIYDSGEPVTREKLLAGIGMGGLFGGVLGGGVAGAGVVKDKAVQKAREKAESLFGKAAKPATAAASEDALERAASEQLGTPPVKGFGEKLRDLYESAQAAVTGVDRETVRKLSPLRWGDENLKAREILFNRDSIMQGAEKELVGGVDDLVNKTRSIADEVVDSRLKEGHVRARLDPARAVEQVEAARAEFRRIREQLGALQATDSVDQIGVANADRITEGMRDIRVFRDKYAGKSAAEATEFASNDLPIKVDVQADGSLYLGDGRHRLAAAQEAGATRINAVVRRFDKNGDEIGEAVTRPVSINALPDAAETYGNSALLGRTDKFIAGLEREIAGDGVTASRAFIALDQAKRALQKQRVSLGRSAARQPDALLQSQAQAAGRALEQIQETTRQNLMGDLWGDAGKAQREINAAWEQWFESKKLFDASAIRTVGEEFDGRAIVAADPEKLSRFLNKVGRQESELVRKHFQNYVDASERLSKAIGDSHDLGDKAATVLEVGDAARKIRGTLQKAQETLGFANQADELLNHNNAALGTAATLSGAVLGGAPGAAIGALLGAVSSPGRSLQSAWGIQRLLGRVDGTITEKVLGALGKTARVAGKAADRIAKGTEAVGFVAERAALSGGAFERFRNRDAEDDQGAYVERREQLAELISNPVKLSDAVTATVSPLAATRPAMAGAMAADMTQALMTLQGLTPNESSLGAFASEDSRFVPEADLKRFAEQWEGVTSPLTILDDLRSGTLTADKRDAVKLAWPALYEHIQGVALAAITENRDLVPVETRTQFDLLLELNGEGEPSVAPSFLANMAKIAAARNQAAPPPRAPTGGASKLADRSRTLTEQATI